GQLRLGVDDGLLGLLACSGQVRLGLAFDDLNLHARVRELGLHGRLGLGLVQGLESLGRRSLAVVGFKLLDRKLPLPQLLEQRLDLPPSFGRVRLADQDIYALDIEVAELAPKLLSRFSLDL